MAEKDLVILGASALIAPTAILHAIEDSPYDENKDRFKYRWVMQRPS